MKAILSIVLLVLGVAVFIYGSNLATQATFEEQRISQVEATGQHRPILGPLRRAARNQAAESQQQMVGQEGQKIVASQVTANWIRGIGVVLFIVGIGGFLCCRKKRS